jgi:hypothetical protein
MGYSSAADNLYCSFPDKQHHRGHFVAYSREYMREHCHRDNNKKRGDKGGVTRS